MITIYAPHRPDAKKLTQVKVEMATLGAPTIRVLDCGDHYKALEGSHRLAAAHALGLTPELDIVPADEPMTDHDCEDLPTSATAGEIADCLYDRPEVAYAF